MPVRDNLHQGRRLTIFDKNYIAPSAPTTTATYDIKANYPNYASLTMNNIFPRPKQIQPINFNSTTITWSYNSATGIVTAAASQASYFYNFHQTFAIIK